MKTKYLSIIFIAVICFMIPICSNAAEAQSGGEIYEIIMIPQEYPEEITTETPLEEIVQSTMIPPNIDSNVVVPSPSVPNDSLNNVTSVSKLMVYCSMSFRSEPGAIYITAKTQGVREMDLVGFTDMHIEKSADGLNWTTEASVDDLLAENAKLYSLDNYKVSVEGGYYYRAVCTHYAELLMPDGKTAQGTLKNSSEEVWVEAQHVIETTSADVTDRVETTVSESTAAVLSDTVETAAGQKTEISSADEASALSAADKTSPSAKEEVIPVVENAAAAKTSAEIKYVQTTASQAVSGKSATASHSAAASETRGAVSSPNTGDNGALGALTLLSVISALVLALRKRNM